MFIVINIYINEYRKMDKTIIKVNPCKDWGRHQWIQEWEQDVSNNFNVFLYCELYV